MTKETKQLYFKNWYVYDVLISLTFFLMTVSLLKVEMPHVFTYILIGLYGILLLVSIHNAYISIKQRIMPDFYTTIFTRTIKNIFKIIELTIYLKVSYYLFKVDGALFFLNMAILVFAMMRIITTIGYIALKLKDECHLYRKKIENPVELKHYLSENRLIIEDFSGDFTSVPKNIVDGELSFFKIKDPTPVVFHKFPPEMFVLEYKKNSYNVGLLNKYLSDNGESFESISSNELDLFKIVKI